MKTIYIFALYGVRTGGPECTHQLSDALLAQGFDARMVYFEWADFVESPGRVGMMAKDEGGRRVYVLPPKGAVFPEYAHYHTVRATEVPDEPNSIIVLPETLANATVAFPNSTQLVWWLSVDFGFNALSMTRLNSLRRPNVRHAYQSLYAKTFLDALQMRVVGPLGDYTTDLSVYATPLAMPERAPRVLMTNRPDKIVYDLEAIARRAHELAPDLEFHLFDRLPRERVAELFATSRLYVDFGIFAGKDRMPREAACMGCDVVVGARGAGATDYEEWGFGVADPDDVEGAARLIAARALTPRACPIANPLAWEKDRLFAEARDVFAQL